MSDLISREPTLRLDDVGYRYPAGASVGPVSLSVHAGEVVLLTGPTGCGKSTVLRVAAGLAGRHGQGAVTGRVRLAGDDPATLPPAARSGRLGLVSQDPNDQIVARTLGDEIAFGLESARWEPAAIEGAIRASLARFGLPADPDRATSALSGGQKQRLVVAAAMAAGPPALLLDEPLAQLDPKAALDLVAELRRLADEGVAVVVVEHRLEAMWPAADRIVVLDGGRVAADAPRDALDLDVLRRLGLAVPGMVDLRDRLARKGLDVGAGGLAGPAGTPELVGASGLASAAGVPDPDLVGASGLAGPDHPPSGAGEAAGPHEKAGPRGKAGPHEDAGTYKIPVVLEATDLRYRWGLSDVSLTLRAGDRVALLGANGSGKSTLIAALAGRIDAGAVHADGLVVDVPQDPDLALFCATVGEEIAYGPTEHRVSDVHDRLVTSAHALSVADLLDRPPQALSRGQRLRVAVAAALACRPRALLLDEPTAGQDADQVERMMLGLRDALAGAGPGGEAVPGGAGSAGAALLFATHDVDLALRHATRVVVLHDGRVVAEGLPADVLAALPADVPLVLPPLAAFCLRNGLPPMSAEAVAALAPTTTGAP